MCLSISLEVSCAYKLYYSLRKEKDLFGQELVQGLNPRMLLTPPHDCVLPVLLTHNILDA